MGTSLPLVIRVKLGNAELFQRLPRHFRAAQRSLAHTASHCFPSIENEWEAVFHCMVARTSLHVW